MPADQLGQLSLEPVRIRGPGPSRHDVDQPRVQASLLISSQIDHRRHRPIPAVMRGSPDVLIDADRADPTSTARIVGAPARLVLHRPPRVCQPTRKCRANAETVVSS